MIIKKIALIPGSFNPLTNAHVQMGIKAKEMLHADKVIFVPANDSFIQSWKKYYSENILSAEDRVQMMMEAFEKYGFYVSAVEISGTVSGKAYDLVKYYKNKNPYAEIYLCYGEDNFYDMPQWYRAEELAKENRFLFFTRSGTYAKKENNLTYKDIKFVEMDCNESSTEVRRALNERDYELIKKLVPEVVYKYLVNGGF